MLYVNEQIHNAEINIASKIVAESWDDLADISADDMIEQIDNLIAVFEGDQTLTEFKENTLKLSTGQLWLN